MARIDILQSDVLRSVVKRLRDELDLSEERSRIVADVNAPPETPSGGDYFLAIAAGSSDFLEIEEQAAEQLCETLTIEIAMYNRVALDRPDFDEHTLLDVDRGLMPVKRAVLKALAGHDLTIHDAPDDTFMRQVLITRCTAPEVMRRADTEEYLARQILTVAYKYDWDLVDE